MTDPPSDFDLMWPLETHANAFLETCRQEREQLVVVVLIARVDDQGEHDNSRVVIASEFGPDRRGHATLTRLLHEYRHLEVGRAEQVRKAPIP
ncbi:hypothetical protein [Deinococcus hopiensis]|uniref:Uncharacterized protein n=1 Tax=Deinococcus hopiensis KR-140 TaxID=695939 RepID=A0A1W1UXR1_9DEIO|nr:hypothetical protein [Deinococcus hopiensis]SMB85873.1 hypothetical protein SAMN00790413_03579 [Deinococcus hopiensis KR-140]